MVLENRKEGYGYKYVELAQIQKEIDNLGIKYQQKVDTDPLTQKDYIYTRSKMKDDKEWSEWVKGAEVVNGTLSGKSNPAQQYGSALTYARRYSLMMYFGIATVDEDDDAECLTETKETKKDTAKQNIAKAVEENAGNQKSTLAQQQAIQELIRERKITPEESKLDMANFGNKNFRDLTKIEADSYIKVLNQYDKIRAKREAQNGKS